MNGTINLEWYKRNKHNGRKLAVDGAPGATRTPDLLIRSQVADNMFYFYVSMAKIIATVPFINFGIALNGAVFLGRVMSNGTAFNPRPGADDRRPYPHGNRPSPTWSHPYAP